MTSATNRAQIRERNAQMERDRITSKEVIVALMSRPDGRRWVWNELSFAQVFVADTSLDPHYMAYEKGRRNTGLRLLSQVLTHSPDQFTRMLNENSASLQTQPLPEDPDGRPDSDD